VFLCPIFNVIAATECLDVDEKTVISPIFLGPKRLYNSRIFSIEPYIGILSVERAFFLVLFYLKNGLFIGRADFRRIFAGKVAFDNSR
jgi:hypothetical protein